ncbi:MAG TPA: nucleotide exchange factor GrpE [Bacteroidota bacterium]|nr:nucleotide exchange factor GrpE [Bacteroidota bacterium]
MDLTQDPQQKPSDKAQQQSDAAGEASSPGEAQQASQNELLAAASAKLAEYEQQLAQLKDQVLRKAAEFDNYKRRTENDFLTFTKYASENVIVQLLPVLDDFHRSLKTGKPQSGDDSFYKGIEMIAAKFLKVLQAQGLKPMDVIGKEFSVDFHDALLQVPRSDVPPHTIVEEVEKGYLLHDKVIRHAKVIVASEAPNETDQPTASEVD